MVITLLIHITIFSIIIFRSFYKSFSLIKNLKFKENLNLLTTSIQIESIPFFINQGKISLFAFAINFFFLSLISFTLLPEFIQNHCTFCQDMFTENQQKNPQRTVKYFGKNGYKIIKKYLDCYETYEYLFQVYSKPEKYSIDYIFKKAYDQIFINTLAKETSISEVYVDSITGKTEFQRKILEPIPIKDSDLVFKYTPDKFKIYLKYFQQKIEDLSFKNIAEINDDPYKRFIEISKSLTRIPDICNNLLKDSLIYYTKSSYLEKEIPFVEILNILNREIPPLYQEIFKYIEIIENNIKESESPQFYCDIKLVQKIYEISSVNIDLIKYFAELQHEKADPFRKEMIKLDKSLYKNLYKKIAGSSPTSSENENTIDIMFEENKPINNIFEEQNSIQSAIFSHDYNNNTELFDNDGDMDELPSIFFIEE